MSDIYWLEYKEHGSIDFKNRLVERYLPYAGKISRYLYGKLPDSITFDEIQSYAYSGLLEAIERYDASNSVSFIGYAAKRIKGAVYDELRQQDFLPRDVRKKGPVEMESIEEIRNAEIVSSDSSQAYTDQNIQQSDFAPVIEDRVFILSLLKKLSCFERKVIYLYFWQGLTMKEIGQTVGYTEGGISIVLKRAITRLKKMTRH